jgi:aspartate aminotransferase-like enzyme
MMLDEGVEAMWKRQACLGATLRQALAGLGLELYARDDAASASVTAVRPPPPATALARLRVAGRVAAFRVHMLN